MPMAASWAYNRSKLRKTPKFFHGQMTKHCSGSTALIILINKYKPATTIGKMLMNNQDNMMNKLKISLKDGMLYNSIYVVCLKRQNYRDAEDLSVCAGEGREGHLKRGRSVLVWR